MTHEDESGAISPSGRFARMEAALIRIEDKLDGKAEQVALEAVSARVTMIEQSGTPQLQRTVIAVQELQRQQLVNDTKVATAKETVGAVADARYASMRIMLWVVSILSGLAVLFSSGLTIANLLNII